MVTTCQQRLSCGRADRKVNLWRLEELAKSAVLTYSFLLQIFFTLILVFSQVLQEFNIESDLDRIHPKSHLCLHFLIQKKKKNPLCIEVTKGYGLNS